MTKRETFIASDRSERGDPAGLLRCARNDGLKGMSGFTLIEMLIVLVIIGLIVGGVPVGQNLIRAAYVRAQISQIEKYNTAVNTFYGKYQALPGDMNASAAASFGFAAREGCIGKEDGNGEIDGNIFGGAGCSRSFQAAGEMEAAGETVMFWSDLTYANGLNINLIPGDFSTATFAGYTGIPIPGTALGLYFPPAAIGGGNYIYVGGGRLSWEQRHLSGVA